MEHLQSEEPFSSDPYFSHHFEITKIVNLLIYTLRSDFKGGLYYKPFFFSNWKKVVLQKSSYESKLFFLV